MDEFLATVGVQAMRYAIRSGIALTSTYAVRQCSRLLKSVEDENVFSELKLLQNHLDSKIKIISPAIDLIEFKSSKGNVFLESAAPLARSLHQEIVSLGQRIEAAAAIQEDFHETKRRSQRRTGPELRQELATIMSGIKTLLDRIDREIPLLQLAISASGESLSTSLPPGISPSRLLQASTFLIVGDTQFAQDPNRSVQIGPAFTLSLYMLFTGHAATLAPLRDGPTNLAGLRTKDSGTIGLNEGDRKPLWQEVLHKARVRLCRIRTDYAFDRMLGYRLSEHELGPDHPSNFDTIGFGYSYHLEIIENLDDGRVHEDERRDKPYDDIASAGIRESIPIHQLSKIFYTDTGRILNVGNTTEVGNKPVLLLKRDMQAPATRQMASGMDNHMGHYGSAGRLIDGDESDEGEGDTQFDIDSQLKEESAVCATNVAGSRSCDDQPRWQFPSHLDPEWIALEVFEEDEEDLSDSDDDHSRTGDVGPHNDDSIPRLGEPQQRSPLDSKVVDQIRNLSIRPTSELGSPLPSRQSRARDLVSNSAEVQDFVARSPFGAITSSLSLVEMLIRLTSLQEFQQASHLSIPDHILNFFLEETSNTGLVGEMSWRVRSEAKRRMGFDPYTDTQTR